MTTSTHRCQAVAHVHANGVVHSDVKPDNVLIDASGRPRLGDFDVSKDATVRRTHVFASTRAAGTFGYLAPEVISGGGATEASDVYSLGRTIAQQQVSRAHRSISSKFWKNKNMVSCCAGARERRGPACTDVLPADSSTFPAKVCTSGREVAALRRPCGQWVGRGAQEATAGDC